mmetsp:Transcript_20743/g.64088  ORF Transcript_20743/g.64088 Transcript_20743/m.64088 type:complete len:81 (+) Transcript_20743:425-667(+)
MVEQGRPTPERGLLLAVAFTRTLGHEPHSESDWNYRKFDCGRVTPIEGVVMRKATAEAPLVVPRNLSDDITYGVFLRKTP